MELRKVAVYLERLTMTKCIVCTKLCQQIEGRDENMNIFKLLCNLLEVHDFKWNFSTELVPMCETCMNFFCDVMLLEKQIEEIQRKIELKAEEIRAKIISCESKSEVGRRKGKGKIKRQQTQTQIFREKFIERYTQKIRIVVQTDNTIHIKATTPSMFLDESISIKDEPFDYAENSLLEHDGQDDSPMGDDDWQPSSQEYDDDDDDDDDYNVEMDSVERNSDKKIDSGEKKKKRERKTVGSKRESRKDKIKRHTSDKKQSKSNDKAPTTEVSKYKRRKISEIILSPVVTTDDGKMLYENIEIFQTDKGYGCSLCDVIKENVNFPKTALRRLCMHVDAAHRGANRCHLCQKPYRSLFSLKKHIENHNKTPKFACEICGKPFQAESTATAHIWSHKSEHEKSEALAVGEVEPNWGYEYSPTKQKERRKERDKKALLLLLPGEDGRIYYENVEIIQTKKGYKCTICNLEETSKPRKTAFALRRMKRHISESHLLRHRCLICQIALNSLKEKKEHEETHKSGSKYICDICAAPFAYKKCAGIHRWLHQSEEEKSAALASGIKEPKVQKFVDVPRRFKCDTCGKLFRFQALLQKHEKSHMDRESRRIHQCHGCGKRYASEEHLQKHISFTHEKEKLAQIFECPTCNRQFRFKSQLFYHSIKHTGVKPHVCSHCNKGFTAASALARHVAAHHNNAEEEEEEEVDQPSPQYSPFRDPLGNDDGIPAKPMEPSYPSYVYL